MSLLQSIRNLVGGAEDKKVRDTVRQTVHNDIAQARAEIQKSKDMRELLTMERQYAKRVKGTGNVTRSGH
jgi:hypothetical protein